MDFFRRFFSTDGFMPHGMCYRWDPLVIWLHVISDGLITLAYYSIPITLLFIVHRRKDLRFSWMFLCFSLFILACGTSHFMEIWNIWHPVYWISGGVKAVTAVSSIVTAILLVGLIPQALSLPSAETTRKKAEDKLRASEERFDLFANRVEDHALLMLDAGGHVITWNAGAERIKGYKEAEITGRHFSCFYPPEAIASGHPDEELRIAATKGSYAEEGWRVRKDGSRFLADVLITAVYNNTGKLCGFAKITRDITARKLVEQQLEEAKLRAELSLEEKEGLLREIHHRVKNNLQVISSLLRLHSAYVRDPADLDIFKDCQMRIHSMALVHDRLYRAGSLARINFGAHLVELATLIARGQSRKESNVVLATDCEDIEVNLDCAVPLGLIATELISNAYKHAFQGRTDGRVTVTFKALSGQDVTLQVTDDGIGLPPELDLAKAKSLGIRLIRSLVGQLRGELIFHYQPLTTIEVILKGDLLRS